MFGGMYGRNETKESSTPCGKGAVCFCFQKALSHLGHFLALFRLSGLRSVRVEGLLASSSLGAGYSCFLCSLQFFFAFGC
jgi:hypothetical protein